MSSRAPSPSRGPNVSLKRPLWPESRLSTEFLIANVFARRTRSLSSAPVSRAFLKFLTKGQLFVTRGGAPGMSGHVMVLAGSAW